MARMHEILGVEPGEVFTVKWNDVEEEFTTDRTGDVYHYEKGFDIFDRYEAASYEIFYMINNPDRIIRKPRYTPEQVEVLKALKVLGMGKWWLAKDGNGDVYAYKRKPKKDVMVWNYYDENGTNAYIPMTTSLVSWPDPEPLSIAQALRDAGVEVEG